MKSYNFIIFIFFIALMAAGCSGNDTSDQESGQDLSNLELPQDNAGLSLPAGFKAMKIADSLGAARHIAVAENGDVYVSLRRQANGGGVVAMRDTDGDGKPDQTEYFGDHAGTGIAIHNGYLYASSTSDVYRYEMPQDSLVPSGEPEVIATGFPEQSQHASKSLAFDNSGSMYVNVGAPSNSCQEQDRSKESPGMKPCPLLERHAGIWQFSATETGQTQQEHGIRYATGLRNVVGLEWNDAQDVLYVTQHGRDMLYQSWPEYYTTEESAALPSETLYEVERQGLDFGWPYSYYNHQKDSIMLAPEYGGDGETTIAQSEYADQFERPEVAFPGHWAPNALTFYDGQQFPQKYRNGAFIAFHGSWNRAPEPQEGYKVVFAPFESDSATGDYEDFATGFPGSDQPQPGTAEHRPTGLTLGPDGSLYITDDESGSVWRVVYAGEDNE